MVAYGIACWDDEENVIAVSSLDAVSEHSEYLEERMSQLNVRECVVEQGNPDAVVLKCYGSIHCLCVSQGLPTCNLLLRCGTIVLNRNGAIALLLKA